jgi:hypothetical protein
MSIMVLTVTDLWVACDKAACRLYGHLEEYDHEIAPKLLWSLLLPLKCHLRRLSQIESYLRLRRIKIKKALSPFRDFGNSSSFAVRYFNQSAQQQQLLAEIEKKAEKERAEKIEKLNQLNKRHQELMELHANSSCENVEVTLYDIDKKPYTEQQHNPRCKRCSYLSQANGMAIFVHEWPVSGDSNKAKATVFELSVPPDFRAWRDVTLYMLQTVLGYKYATKKTVRSDYGLRTDPGVKHLLQSNIERVGIRSDTKPNAVTHRREISIPSSQAYVCLANGLSYAYYDLKADTVIGPLVATSRLHEQCTFVLPAHSKQLQKFMYRTPNAPNGPEPNEVIASLSECPDRFSLEEFKAFAVLPLGYNIQWQNILGQLAIPSLDFTKVETTLLLLQISQQSGPDSKLTQNSLERVSHAILTDERFSTVLLAHLCEARRRIGENWESFQAVATFTCLAARLLASSPFPKIQTDCLEYLASCRSLLFRWVTRLRGKVQSCTNDTQRAESTARAVEVALICISSFEIDREHLSKILHSTNEASVYLQCSIVIQERLSSSDQSSSSLTAVLLTRWRKLMYKTYPELVSRIVELRSSCLDLAIKEFWADYKAGSSWQVLPVPNQDWLKSKTACGFGSNSFSIHFNLLTAELLVNGAPLAKLPGLYETQVMYSTLFGRSPIQVTPSSRPGFQFSSRCEYASHLVDFGMLSNVSAKEMLLHAVKDSCAYSLVPSRVLSGKLPHAFVRDYVHWFDHQLQAVYFVPISDPWSRNPQYWRLSNNGAGWILSRGKSSLMNIDTEAARVIANIFCPLEDSLFLHISFNVASERVDIELPRLRLAFFFNVGSDAVASRQYQGMFIDPSQNVGTLFGLTSKLVLKSAEGSRRVLIPEGSVSWAWEESEPSEEKISGYSGKAEVTSTDSSFTELGTSHVSVSVQRGILRVHAYRVDDQLGRLVGSGSMQSMLSLCYLHALTSYCLPDPLIGLTGTEQALTILSSAAVRSFDILDQDNLNTLNLIAQLAPKRSFYPEHLQEMQTIQWDHDLSFLSQHSQLYLEIRDIFTQAIRSKPLYPAFIDTPSLNWTTLHLLERDLIRSSTFRVSGFGVEEHTDQYDVCYQQRDCGQRSDRAQRTFAVARSILKKQPVVHNTSLQRLDGHLWRQLSLQQQVSGPLTALKRTGSLYGSHLLGQTGKYLANQWCPAHISLSRSDWKNIYGLMMWLSTLAFALQADMLLVETVVSFYCVPALERIKPPNHEIFHVARGSSVGDLASLITRHFRPLAACPEAVLGPLPRESADATWSRRKRIHRIMQSTARKDFDQKLRDQWPCECPACPVDDKIEVYIDINSVMAAIIPVWKTWWENLQLRNYFSDIEKALSAQPYRVLDTSLVAFHRNSIHKKIQKRHIRNEDVFDQPPPQLVDSSSDNLASLVQSNSKHEQSSTRVGDLLSTLESRVSAGHEQLYVDSLRESVVQLNRDSKTYVLAYSDHDIADRLLRYRDHCR